MDKTGGEGLGREKQSTPAGFGFVMWVRKKGRGEARQLWGFENCLCVCVRIRACSCLALCSLGHTAHPALCLFIFYLSHVLHLDFSVYSCELHFHPMHHQVVGITFPVVGWIVVGLNRSSRVGERNFVLRISCRTELQLCFISHQGLVARFQLAFFLPEHLQLASR